MSESSPVKTLLFASGNRHKTGEIQALIGSDFLVTDLSSLPSFQAPEENGADFESNALIKAAAAAARSDAPVLADDSGLEVDALGGAPGVHTARYAGIGATDSANRTKLLQALSGSSNRSARFVCVLALITQGTQPVTVRGEIRGRIALNESGDGGFGYDPIFIPDGFEQSFAELPASLKNRISHRAVAMRKLRELGLP
jgi:XTP/dITP diphosphohydrolase